MIRKHIGKWLMLAICALPVIGSCKAIKNNEKKNMKTEEVKLANQNDLVFYVKFQLKPKYVGDFRKSLLELAETMSHEETFVSTFLHIDPNDSTKYTIYERWNEPTMEDFFKKQLKGKAYRDYYESHIEEWSATTRAISVLKPMQHWVSKTLESSNNDLTFKVDFHIKVDKIEAWKEELMHVLNSMASEDTFVAAFLHQDTEDPTKFTIYERWAEKSIEDFKANHLQAKEYRKTYEEHIAEYSASPRDIQVLNPINSWVK